MSEIEMIRIRVDDVMWESSNFKGGRYKAISRVKQIHRWLMQKPDIFIHVPTIVVDQMNNWPEITKFLQEEVKENRIFPQIHGYSHVDYNSLPDEEVYNHLREAIKWFDSTLGFYPSVWATPWGAESRRLRDIARTFNLTVEGVKKVIDPGAAVQLALQHGSVGCLYGKTIFTHWWNRGLNLLRLVEIAKYGAEEAREKRKDLFE